MKKIVYDDKIPYVDTFLGDAAELIPLPADRITPGTIRDADAIIIRTRTKADRGLLQHSRCRVIATATIGIDHIDRPWSESNGIKVANAPGCNAPAVAQWVFSAIAAAYAGSIKGKTIGIVGAGHVGGIVARWATGLGFNVLVCDPPRAQSEGSDGFCNLDEIASKADFITFHTPLTRNGEYPTFHLADETFFSSLKRKPFILNAARGPVIDTQAILDAFDKKLISGAMIDCWENEPHINRSLLEKAIIATPHIAGYSIQGKIRATAMAATFVSRQLGITPSPINPSRITKDAQGNWIEVSMTTPDHVTMLDISSSYDPLIDTANLKSAPVNFENLRDHYNLRQEVITH